MRLDRHALAASGVMLAIGCGPTYDEPDMADVDRDGDWRDNASEEIPPPISRGWPIRGGDPDSDEQRVACVEEIDISRVHIGRAIDSARSIRAHERMRCLSDQAAFLKTIRTHLVAPSLSEGALSTPTACLEAQRIVLDARACR
ncbi:MAG: hypothetical protein HOW73_31345 [Polyangiaceae bacterium]|nr:hypothetical protein [Polyangiaceae bacterium]